MPNWKKLAKQRLLRDGLQDAAAGIKRKKCHNRQTKPSLHPNSHTQTTPTTSAVQPQQTRRPIPSRHSGKLLPFPHPEVLGEPPEVEYDHENMQTDPRYTGGFERNLENQECSDPDAIKEMECEERAIWLGKWFAHHYAAWVEDFELKELETYETLPMETQRDTSFRLGLRRFRNEVVSTLHTHAIRIFSITDIVTIDERDQSTQVAALRLNYTFLYGHGNVGLIEEFMRSDCMALRVILFGPAALDGPDQQKSRSIRAVLFNVKTVRKTLAAFIATVLWFLLIDSSVFHDKGAKEGYKKFYRDRMLQLERLHVDLPDIYNSWKEFMDANVFGQDEEEMGDPNEEAQKEYMDKFYADVEKKAHQTKGKGRADVVTSPSQSANGSEG
ncbi:hypothetical protein BJ322DRAFT_1018158 [Thelephora terrestris]|uniref:Uncharacterized protein n=1 Tax=Thelephora terrestris TaxID=56493 RepID=A0A9P6LAJ0_9AGAM|nr:hypothetical protein BJ322DRAFT_1018158 [Thelephora terrestris]